MPVFDERVDRPSRPPGARKEREISPLIAATASCRRAIDKVVSWPGSSSVPSATSKVLRVDGSTVRTRILFGPLLSRIFFRITPRVTRSPRTRYRDAAEPTSTTIEVAVITSAVKRPPHTFLAIAGAYASFGAKREKRRRVPIPRLFRPPC